MIGAARRPHLSVLLASCFVLLGSPALAQQWNLEASAGRIRSALDPAATASESVLLGIRYDDRFTALRISAGVPTRSEAPLWAALGASRRLAVHQRTLIAGLDLGANGLLLHDRVERTRLIPGLLGSREEAAPSLSGFAAAAQLMPVLGFETPRVQAHARAGVSLFTSRFGDVPRDRTVRVADLQLTLAPTSSLALVPMIRYVNADDSYTSAGVTGIVSHGRATAWGSVGHWFGVEADALQWSVGSAFRVARRATLSASARRDAFDPLYLNPPQTSWNVGFAVQVGGITEPRAPVPSAYQNGRATIRLPVSASPAPARIAGDFNAWKPEPMQRAGGHWTFTVPLEPGVYNYSFVNERGEWFVPEKHPGRKDDGMGGHVAVLVVQR